MQEQIFNVKVDKFELGCIVATPGVLDAVTHIEIAYCLNLHAAGNWGLLEEGDKALNDEAVLTGEDYIFSVYKANDGTKFNIITERDRSCTTILLPEEY